MTMTTNAWTGKQRRAIYEIINRQWEKLDIDAFEAWLAGLGITWVELDNEVTNAPAGTVAIWEGPGFTDETRRQCWAVPDAVAARLIDATA